MEEDDPAKGLMLEAQSLLKSLRSFKALQIKQVGLSTDSSEAVALLDGGATHALRQARDWELPDLSPVQVELAQGEATLYRHPGTIALLSKLPFEPIIPLRMLVDRGYQISWNQVGCSIKLKEGGRLNCWLRNGCPVMP